MKSLHSFQVVLERGVARLASMATSKCEMLASVQFGWIGIPVIQKPLIEHYLLY
jgi:hypothetical protein